MAKFAVLFLAALAFQASVAIPRYFEEGHLFGYLDKIKIEVNDLTVYFENDFPEHQMAIKTVTWECNKLIDIVEHIIKKVREETFDLRTDDKVFEEVIYILEEVVLVFKRVIEHDVTDVHGLRKLFVLSIHTVCERLEKLVKLTYTYYPQFRFTLKYLLVDVMTTLQGIRSHFMHVNREFKVVPTTRSLIKDIHEYTRVFTDILKDFTHRTQVKVALRGYFMYVKEIVRVLEEYNVSGHKELDIVLGHLTDKLRKIDFHLMEIMDHNIVDVTTAKTEIITDVLDIVHIFEQLVQLCEDKVLPDDLTSFLVRIIFHYFYAVKHVCYEIKFGYKIGFYMNKYYDTDFYRNYGFGLYEKDMIFHKWNKYTFTPYMYKTMFSMDNYMGHIYGNTNWDRYNIRNMKNVRMMRDFEYRMTHWNTHNMEHMTPMHGFWDDRSLDWDMEFSHNSRMDLVKTIQVLSKRVRDVVMYDNVELNDMHHIILYRIREFINILDWVLEKYEMKMIMVHDNRVVVELIDKVRRIKMELVDIVKMGVFTDLHMIKMMYLRSIEAFCDILMNWLEMYRGNDVYVKEICYKFITFLRKICMPHMHMMNDWTFNTHKHMMNDWTFNTHKHMMNDWTFNTHMPMVYNRWMK